MSRYLWPAPPPAAEPGGGDDPGARAGYNALRRASGIGRRPLTALAASRTVLPQPAGPRAPPGTPGQAGEAPNHLLWQPLGPSALLMGQAAGTPYVTGRVNALAVSDNGLRIYAASANGGIWYSENGGDRWHSLGGFAATQFAGIKRPAHRNACGAVCASFGATLGDDVVFVGTGEAHADPGLGVPDSSGEDPHLPEGGVGILVADHTLTLASADPWTVEATNLANGAVYRIVRDPAGGADPRTIAATRTGLWQRPTDPANRHTWERPTGAPFDTFNGTCTDILWTPAQGTAPARLWVWVQSGNAAQSGLWVRETANGPFAQVATIAASTFPFGQGRGSLAAATPPTRIYVHNDHGNAAGTTAGLYRVSNPAAGVAPQGQYVNDAPNVVGGQGFYNLAIAVDPSNPDTVALGGSYLSSSTPALNIWMRRTPDDHDLTNQEWDGAIVIATITTDGAGQLWYGSGNPSANFDLKNWQRVGLGVHADVHELRYADGGRVLWTANDGGCARALRANTATPFGLAAFHGRGEGMAVAESNFIAGHPALEGRLICGLQDNGVGERLSGGVWQHRHYGDAGDVLIDRVQPDRWLAQMHSSNWADDASNFQAGLGSDGAAFYSSGDVIAQTRPAPPPAGAMRYTQYLVGTTRAWTREGVAGAWVTLPSGTPGGAAGDELGESVCCCRWQTPDIAWVLTPTKVLRYRRAAGSHHGAAGTLGDWATAGIQRVLQKNEKNKDDTTGADGPVRDAAAWTELACNVLADGTGALYLGTSGHADKTTVDTLWWFDGTIDDSTHWFATRLRAAVPAPVTAIAIDPALPAEVWVGTTVGVWHGVRTRPAGQPPQWQWTQRVNGLPEAPVEDLEIFQRGTLKLLRAGIGSRGMWELRLDTPELADTTYLRVHEDDLRHALPSHDRARDNTTERSWHGSPDVRPRVKARALAAPPAATPWHRTATPQPWTAEQMRRFQCALRARNPNDRRILCDGEWDPYFSEVLRDLGAPTRAMPAVGSRPAYQRVEITRVYWNSIVTGAPALAEPWGAGVPSLVELLDMKPALTEGSLNAASCTMPPQPCQVDVVVHHRGLNPRLGADVRVTLLKWLDPRSTHRADPDNMVLGTGPRQWPFAAPMPWTATVSTMLNSAGGASTALTNGWSYVGTTNATRRRSPTGQTLVPLEPVVVTFDVDFSSVPNNRLVLLVAVIRAGADAALPAASLRDLVLGQATVAARSVRIRR